MEIYGDSRAAKPDPSWLVVVVALGSKALVVRIVALRRVASLRPAAADKFELAARPSARNHAIGRWRRRAGWPHVRRLVGAVAQPLGAAACRCAPKARPRTQFKWSILQLARQRAESLEVARVADESKISKRRRSNLGAPFGEWPNERVARSPAHSAASLFVQLPFQGALGPHWPGAEEARAPCLLQRRAGASSRSNHLRAAETVGRAQLQSRPLASCCWAVERGP